MSQARTEVVRRALRPEELSAFVADARHGAQTLFVGCVRSPHEGREVSAVTYDAFEPLASAVLARIAAEACGRFGARVAAAHRLGRLSVGEASVAVAAGAAHRAEAFAACRYVIDEVKTRLPVWKKEHDLDGGSEWLSGHLLQARR